MTNHILVTDEAQGQELIGRLLQEGNILTALAVRQAVSGAWGTNDFCQPSLNNTLNTAAQDKISQLRSLGDSREADLLEELLARP